MDRAMKNIAYRELHLAVHLAFVCSLRIGEVLGLTWDCVDFDNGVIHIEKTCQRIKKDTLNKVSKESICFQFPEVQKNKKSIIILKKTKTVASDRFICMTKPLTAELLERRKYIEQQQLILGWKYSDYNLVMCLPNGRPISPGVLEGWFKAWIDSHSNQFPHITFHGIRHSSITYQIELSGGNIQAVQNNSGHATASILLGVYSHLRKGLKEELAHKFEENFYLKNKEEHAEPLNIDVIEQIIVHDPVIQSRIRELIVANSSNIY